MSERPGERVQEFWCDGCRCYHRATVLGGLIDGHAPSREEDSNGKDRNQEEE